MLASICVNHTEPGFENNGKFTTNEPLFIKELNLLELHHLLRIFTGNLVHEAEFSGNSIFIFNLTEDQLAFMKES